MPEIKSKPDTLSAAEAIELINTITDVSVLRGWLEKDKRPTVQQAAKDRIVTLQPAPMQLVQDDPYRQMRKAAAEFMQKGLTLKGTNNYHKALECANKVLGLIPEHKEAAALHKELTEIIEKRSRRPCAKCTHFRTFEANPDADQGHCVKNAPTPKVHVQLDDGTRVWRDSQGPRPPALTETRSSCGDFERRK